MREEEEEVVDPGDFNADDDDNDKASLRPLGVCCCCLGLVVCLADTAGIFAKDWDFVLEDFFRAPRDDDDSEGNDGFTLEGVGLFSSLSLSLGESRDANALAIML